MRSTRMLSGAYQGNGSRFDSDALLASALISNGIYTSLCSAQLNA